jgi:hypothetical protein
MDLRHFPLERETEAWTWFGAKPATEAVEA